MVNVKIGVLRKSRMDEIDKVFESASFSVAIVRPERFISGRISVNGDYTKEKGESPRRLEKRMSFEIKDDVTCGASVERCESTPVFNRKLVPHNRITTLSLQLQRGLIM